MNKKTFSMKKVKSIIYLGMLCSMLGLGACSDDFTNLEPVGQLTPEQIAKLPESKKAVALEGKLYGIYSSLQLNPSVNNREENSGLMGIGLVTDLISSDVAMFSRGSYSWYWDDYTYNVSPGTDRARSTWGTFYNMIYGLNGILEQITEVPTNAKLATIYAQASTLRAFMYFNLINLYQHPYLDNPNAKGVPVYTTSSVLEPKGRGTVKEVYDQIIKDLTNADAAFKVADEGTGSKGVISKSVFDGIYANVMLFMGNYTEAAARANSARTGSVLMDRSLYHNGFNKSTNPEWMWGCLITAVTSNKYNSWLGQIDNRIEDDGYAPYDMQKMMDQQLFNHIHPSDIRYEVFHVDARKDIDVPPTYENTAWADKFFNEAGKETDYISDIPYMRVAEMYLLEAEALARGGKDNEAKDVLVELIKKRCNDVDPYGVNAMNHDQLMNEIQLQARIELWGEGKAYLIKKRFKIDFLRNYSGTNHNASVLVNHKYNDRAALFFIPDTELNNNPNIKQEDQN